MDSPNFDLDIETLLEAKISYHKEQMKFHAKMAAETRRKLDLLTEKLNPQPPTTYETLTQLNLQKISSEVVTKNVIDSPLYKLGASLLPVSQNFSVTYWKPLVEKVLRENPVKTYKTEDILREIDSRYLHNEDLRKRAIAVISSSLFALVQNNIVKKIENEGNRGNLYIIAHK